MRRRPHLDEDETLKVKVGDVAAATESYTRLGLRVLRQTPNRAVLELPSGLHVVLYQTAINPAA
jgi:hypothetical protein